MVYFFLPEVIVEVRPRDAKLTPLVGDLKKQIAWPVAMKHYLGGGFKTLLFSPLLGEMIEFD